MDEMTGDAPKDGQVDRDLLRAILEAIDSLQEVFVLFDRDDRIVHANRLWRERNAEIEEFTRRGVRFEDYLRAVARAGLAPPAEGREQAWIAERMEQHRNPGPSFEVQRQGGNWYRVREQRLPDGGIVVTGVDITERRRAEQALQRSEERFKDFTEVASDWLWEQDTDLRFTALSPEMYTKTGLSTDDYLGKTRRETQPLGVSEERWCQHDADLAARRPFRGFRFHRINPAGRVHHVSVSGKPLFDAGGRFTGYRGVGRDITSEVVAMEREASAEQRFTVAIEAMSDGFILLDRDGRLVACNERYKDLFPGLDDLLVPGTPFESVLRAAAERGQIADAIGREEEWLCEHLAAYRDPRRSLSEQHLADGRWILIHTSRTGDGAVAIRTDITELKRAEGRVRTLSHAVEQSPAPVMITDPQGRIEFVNRKFVELTGYSSEEAVGRNPRFLRSGHTPPETYDELWKTVLAGEHWQGELQNSTKDGRPYWENLLISPIKSESGEIVHFLALMEDISPRKELEQHLLRQATFDPVTGLPNRALVLDRLSQAMAQVRRRDMEAALLFIDLDGFKQVNDTHGHEAGDQVLEEAAKRMSDCLREPDTVGRLGGDEFAIILHDVDGVDSAEVVARKILTVFDEPFKIDSQLLRLSASIGVSVSPRHGEDPKTLMRNADVAMYRVKTGGRNGVQVYDPS